jgi:hypothetical protein
MQLEEGVDGGRPRYGVRGGGASLAFHLQPGNYNTESLI